MFSDNFTWLIRQGNLQFEQFVCTLRIGRCNQTPEIGVNLQDGIDEEWKKTDLLGWRAVMWNPREDLLCIKGISVFSPFHPMPLCVYPFTHTTISLLQP